MKPERITTCWPRLPLHLAGGLLVLALASPASQGQPASRIYKCTDAKGKVYVTQTPPPECLGRPTDVLNRRGTVVQRDEGILTPQQQAQREAELKKKAEMESAAKEERRRAAALLNTYSSEKDVGGEEETGRHDQRQVRRRQEALHGVGQEPAQALNRRLTPKGRGRGRGPCTPLAPGTYCDSLRLRMPLTCAGLALPLVAFIT